MSGDVHPDIKPSGLTTKDLVDTLYQAVAAIKALCTKLDSDGGVTAETYVANCYTAIFNTVITDSKGNRTGQVIDPLSFSLVSQMGYTPKGIVDLLYEIFNSVETLTEQLDGDSLTFTNYEATSYTAVFTQLVMNREGSALGNGTAVYTFNHGVALDQKQLVECLYNIVEGIQLICADNTTTGLDGDGTVTDTNYEELIFTGYITNKIQNSAGSLIGN